MTRQANISLKKIETLKKRLQKLPLKDEVKSREEAVEILKASFQEALKKGYTLKELRAMFTEEGVTLPLSMLKKQITGDQEQSARIIVKGARVKAKCNEPEFPAGFTIKQDTPDEEL